MGISNTYELNTSDFLSGIKDELDQQITVNTIEELPSANVISSFSEYLHALPRIVAYFRDQINTYNRQDYMERSFPSLNVYQKGEQYIGTLGWLVGQMGIKFCIGLDVSRQNISSVCALLSNYIYLAINNGNILGFMRQYNPGLVEIGYNPKIDYTKAGALQGEPKVNAYEVNMVAEYRINMLEYYLALGDNLPLSNINILTRMEK